MRNKILDIVQSFSKMHFCKGQPLLVALSGGPDSICLFYALYMTKELHGAPLHIVHLNHGWRKESNDEAKVIQMLADKYDVPCHIRVLDPSKYTKNKEDASRDERFQFFSELHEQLNSQGVVLAHHRGDLQETVLKRVFEGACLTKLSGMVPVTKRGKLRVMRPLLGIDKEEIIAWLNENNITYFEDPTNEDTKFLRARMRKTIFPFLVEQFQKNITKNLSFLSAESDSLNRYLQEKIAPFLLRKETTFFGFFFDFAEKLPDHSIETSFLIRKIAEIHHFCLSRDAIETIVAMLHNGSANKYISYEKTMLYIDRRKLFFIQKYFLPIESCLAQEGAVTGGWRVSIQKYIPGERVYNHWKYMISGFCSTLIPNGDVELSSYMIDHQKLSKQFQEYKVPRFLVDGVPVVVQNGVVIRDFLCGIKMQAPNNQCFLKIELKRNFD